MKVKLKNLLNVYKNLSTPARASIWFLVCNILQMGLNVLSTPIFTRIMEQEEFGITNTYNSWRSILIIFTSLNLSYGVFNNAMVKYEDAKTRDQYVSSMQCLYTLITFSYFVFYLIARDWCNRVLNMSTGLVILMFVDLLCYPALLFWSGRQRYEFKYKGLVIITLLMSVISIAAGVVAVCLSENKAMAKIVSTIAVNVIFSGAFYLYHFINACTKTKEAKYVLGYFSKANGFTNPTVYEFEEDGQFVFESIMYSAMTLYNNGGASRTKLAESHRRWENELSRKNEEKLSRTQELNTAKVLALKELGYTEINEHNASEVFDKIAEIQSRGIYN